MDNHTGDNEKLRAFAKKIEEQAEELRQLYGDLE